MALPVNIHELLNGLTVEWERLEFKEKIAKRFLITELRRTEKNIKHMGVLSAPQMKVFPDFSFSKAIST